MRAKNHEIFLGTNHKEIPRRKSAKKNILNKYLEKSSDGDYTGRNFLAIFGLML